MMSKENETEFWFNIKTGQVEQGKQSIAVYRIGPFKTREEAEQANAIIAAKAKAWREENQRED